MKLSSYLAFVGVLVVGAALLRAAEPTSNPNQASSSQIQMDVKFILVNEETYRRIAPALLNKKDGGRDFGILDEDHVGPLIEIVKESKDATIMSSPRMILNNGQRGVLSIGQEISYIASYEAKDAKNPKMGYAPKTALVKPGLAISLQPAVSTNGKMILMGLDLSAIFLRDITNLPARVPGDSSLQIQMPRVSQDRWITLLAVPLGGTAVLGGIKVGGDELHLSNGAATEQEARRLLVVMKPSISTK